MADIAARGLVNRSAALTGSSQTLANFNASRTYLLVHNPGANALWLRVDSAPNQGATAGQYPAAVADAAGTIELVANATITWEGGFVPSAAVRVIGTAAQPVTCYEGG